MATGDLELANGVIKIVGGKIEKQYEESAILHNRMSKGKGKKLGDRGYEIPTHLEGNYNYRFMTDGGDYPAGGAPLVKRASVFFKSQANSMRVTGAAVDSISSGDVSYVENWLETVMDDTVSAAKKTKNIHGWGTGNGRLATISTGANSVTQTVNNNDANRFLRAGTAVDVIAADGTVIRGSTTIANPSASATTLTLAAAVNSTTGDYIVPSGSFNNAVTGIEAMIDDTTDAAVNFQGISRNTYTSYRANRVNAASTGLDVSYLRRLLGAGIHIKAGELNRSKLELWTHPAQTAAYSSLGWNLKRFTGNSKSLDLGFTTYEYEGIAMVEDVDAPKDAIYAIDWSTIQKFVAKEAGWDDKTGGILRQVPSSTSGVAYTDQYEAYYTCRDNYGCVRPNANGWVDNLSVPTGF
jgi:hypothetical protein